MAKSAPRLTSRGAVARAEVLQTASGTAQNGQRHSFCRTWRWQEGQSVSDDMDLEVMASDRDSARQERVGSVLSGSVTS
jgi:hypothetical protein